MPTIEYQYDFHPVGQGLFASGQLRNRKSQESYTWVYDCGTSSSKNLVDDALGALKLTYFPRGPKKPRLDLVVLSHFDGDHINGVVRLLSEFSVDVLLLPYMSLWQRLLLAFDEGVDTQQELMPFFLNPATYLREQGRQIERIIFVPPSSPEQTPDDSEPGGLTPENFSLERARVPQSRPSDEPALFGKIGETSPNDKGPAGLLQAGAKITVGNVWEFVPYNDLSLAKLATGTFQATVDQLESDLLTATNEAAQRAALKRIRDAYDKQFGKSPKMRNLISLFVYSGPCVSAIGQSVDWTLGTFPRAYAWRREVMHQNGDSTVAACLYTGDGYLDSRSKLEHLRDFVGRSRIKGSRLEFMRRYGPIHRLPNALSAYGPG